MSQNFTPYAIKHRERYADPRFLENRTHSSKVKPMIWFHQSGIAIELMDLHVL